MSKFVALLFIEYYIKMKLEKEIKIKKIIFIVGLSLINLIFISNVNANELESVKYFKTVTNPFTNYSQTYEITEEEFNNVNEIELYSTIHTTEYKKIAILKQGEGNILLEVTWKKNPAVRSYDVIAIRGEGVSFNGASIKGKQFYTQNGTPQVINYTINSNNTKVFENGAGISMNLVDGASNYTLRLEIEYTKENNNATIYGSYQHSQRNITLEQSQRYILSSSGFGNVLAFDSSVKSYFDGMGGVSIGA